MKKTLLSLSLLLSVSLFSQGTKEFYGKINYAFIPHNMLNGAGYTFGYEWNNQNPVSYKIETGMLAANRVRKMDETIGEIRLKDLYYNLAQMNVAIIPTWNFLSSNRLQLSAGIGLSCAYQSIVFTLSHYEYPRNIEYDLWNNVMTVDASSGLHVGLLGDLNISYRLSNTWQMSLSTQYHLYHQGEQLLSAGIGIAYQF